jgi:hypothetical protein
VCSHSSTKYCKALQHEEYTPRNVFCHFIAEQCPLNNEIKYVQDTLRTLSVNKFSPKILTILCRHIRFLLVSESMVHSYQPSTNGTVSF